MPPFFGFSFFSLSCYALSVAPGSRRYPRIGQKNHPPLNAAFAQEGSGNIMPITNANLIPDLRLATALDAALKVILHDEMSLRTTGSVMNLGSINGTGAASSTIRYAGLDGFDSFAPAGETAVVAETVFQTASAQIAVGRAALRRDISDLAVITGLQSGDVDPMRLAQSMVGGYEQYFNLLAAAAINTFTTSVGATTVDMTVDDYYDAVFALEVASVPGPYFCLLAPTQLANFQESLRAEGGAAQWMPATADMLQIKGQGYAGNFLGVDIYKSDKIIEDGSGDAHGGMWGLGALGYKTGTVLSPMGGFVTSPGSEIVVEFERVAHAATTEIVGHAYLGLSVLEDARGVQIVTDGV